MFRIICLMLVLLPAFSFAQESKLGNWLLYFGNKQINEKFNWHHEVQYRNYNVIGDLEQLLLRTGVGYNLTEKNNNLLLGYGYILSENYIGNEKLSVNEHRIYQQFVTKQNFGRIKISHRYRFEQRFVEEDFRLRFRYFLALKVILNKKDFIDDAFYLAAYNEIFLNTRNTIFDRDRLYGGLGYKLNKTLRFEIGYLNQFFTLGKRDQINLITFINF